MRFCGGCAAPLAEAGASAPPADQHDGRALATALGERRLVTVLFADVSGFTSLSEKLDPEALRDLTTACFDRLVPSITRYGGTIDKFVGDEVMALFGAPVAHENDAERALSAALEMRQALEIFNRDRRISLAVHFGVNTGLVYAGGLGGGGRKDYSVMGDPVNVAARLKALAEPGEILVGADTYRQADPHFEWGAAVPVTLKGKAEPVTAHRLLGARTEGRRYSRALSSPLVGRDDEVALLGLALGRLSRGQGGIVTVVGEAGLGKSRLVAEVREAVGERVRWLKGRTLSFGRTISYWPLLEIIQQDAGIESDDPEAERWGKLATRVMSLFGEETPDILPYLATLLNLPVTEEFAPKVRHLDGEAMSRQVYRASLLFFRRVAQERPLILVFEDVHWLDGSSASLLEHLLPLTKEAAILFCFVSRPETETALTRLQELGREQYSDLLTEIALQPLSADESAALVRNLVQLEDLPPRLCDTILDKAEGNPFFVEEVVRSLIDLGGLVRDEASGHWRVTEQATRIAVPDTLQGVIMARVDRLDEDLKQVLRLASVVGRSFFYRVLAGITEADRDLDRSLADLESRELVREKTRDPELEYIFKHALVQEATYESILLQRRKEIHRKVAATVEELFADRLEEFYSLLAYHYSRAEDWEKAQEYLFKAGDQAGSIAADTEALVHYREAMGAYATAFGERWDPMERASLERKIGEALYRRGDHEQAREHVYLAMGLLGVTLPVSASGTRWAIGRAAIRQIGHRVAPPSLWFRRRQFAARTLDELFHLANVAFGMEVVAEPERVALLALQFLNVAEENEWSEVAGGAAVVGFVCLSIPAHRLAGHYLRRSLRLAEPSCSPLSLGVAHFFTGLYEQGLGNWQAALDHYNRAASTYLEIGDTRNWVAVGGNLVNLWSRCGAFSKGIRLAQDMVAAGETTGDKVALAWGLGSVGQVSRLAGDYSTAEVCLRRAIDLLGEAGDLLNLARNRAWLGLCFLSQGKLEQGIEALESSRRVITEHHLRCVYGTETYNGLALARLIVAEKAEGRLTREALREAEEVVREALDQGRFDRSDLMTAYRVRGTYEWLRGHPGKAGDWWRKSLELADKLGARYEGACTRIEIGRRLDDRAQLDEAEAEFAEMEAAVDLAEARRLLGRELDPSASSGETEGPNRPRLNPRQLQADRSDSMK